MIGLLNPVWFDHCAFGISSTKAGSVLTASSAAGSKSPYAWGDLEGLACKPPVVFIRARA